MLPRSGVRNAFDALHGGGLSGAVGSDQTENFAVVYFEGHFVHGYS